MLVLSREVGEEIVIDGRIRLTVLSVEGRRVRLGIAAPTDVPVRRQEVLLRLKEGEHPTTAGCGSSPKGTQFENPGTTQSSDSCRPKGP